MCVLEILVETLRSLTIPGDWCNKSCLEEELFAFNRGEEGRGKTCQLTLIYNELLGCGRYISFPQMFQSNPPLPRLIPFTISFVSSAKQSCFIACGVFLTRPLYLRLLKIFRELLRFLYSLPLSLLSILIFFFYQAFSLMSLQNDMNHF